MKMKAYYYFVSEHHLAKHCWLPSSCSKQIVCVIVVEP